MEIGSQPYSGGPALIKGFGSLKMREILMEGEWEGEFSLKRSLNIFETKFPKSSISPGGPDEITNLTLALKPKLILLLSGFGYVIALDCREDGTYLFQPTIFRLTAGREEGIFIPSHFAYGYLFKSTNSLFLDVGENGECNSFYSPFDFKINYFAACGVSEGKLKLVEKNSLDRGA